MLAVAVAELDQKVLPVILLLAVSEALVESAKSLVLEFTTQVEAAADLTVPAVSVQYQAVLAVADVEVAELLADFQALLTQVAVVAAEGIIMLHLGEAVPE
jgi:hypothetical protein